LGWGQTREFGAKEAEAWVGNLRVKPFLMTFLDAALNSSLGLIDGAGEGTNPANFD
jgi:hypothetical protein